MATASQVGAHRLRRRGGDAQARDEVRAARSSDSRGTRPTEAAAQRARRRVHAASTTCAQRRPIAAPRCATSCAGSGWRRGAPRVATRVIELRRCHERARTRLRRATALIGERAAARAAQLHVAGAATYTDDIAEPRGTLHVAVGAAPGRTRASSRSISTAVRAAPGVVAVVTAGGIPGRQRRRPDPARRSDLRPRPGRVRRASRCSPWRRPSVKAARRAAKLARFDYRAVARDPDHRRRAGGAERTCCRRCTSRAAMPRPRIARRRTGCAARLRGGGQDHFYLEGQIALAVPREHGGMQIHARRSIRAKCSTWSRTRSASPRTMSSSNAGAWAAASAARKRRWRCSPASPRITRAPDRARGQAAPRPRRRHALDRQAPRVRVRVRRRLRRRRAASSGSTSRSRRAAGFPPTCPAPSTTARCSTSTTPTGCPTSRSQLPLQDQHGLRYRVPRLRRPAGHVPDRARDRRDRAVASAAIRSTCAAPTCTARRRAT